ncbi:MAG: glycosyltransferase family 39 protein, partial [Gemmatimonadaceae bacterium]
MLQPISNDQGVALWAGDVINKGGVLYRDAWDTRGPAPYYFTSLIVALLGRNAWGFRLVDLIIQVVGAWGISLLIKRLGGTRVSAVLGAAFYLLWYASLQFQDSAQADGWVGVLLVFTAYALVYRSPPTYWLMFASGLLLGICVLNKPTYGLCVLMPAIYAARQPVTASRWARSVAVAALGCILPVAIAVLYFWHEGVLWTAYDVYIRYNVLVYGHLQDPWLARLLDAGQQLLGLPMVFAVPLVAVGVANVWRRNRYACALLVWWLIATLLNQMIQHKPWAYEWLPTLAPFAILSGFAVSRLPDVFTSGDAVQTTGPSRARTSL